MLTMRNRWTTVGLCLCLLTTVVGAQAPGEPPLPRISPAGYLIVDFWRLGGFDYNPLEWDTPTPKRAGGVVPPYIRKLSGQRVEIVGNFLPLDFDDAGVPEFILNATVDACGFGGVPRINEWIHVRMKPGERARAYKAGEEVLVRGILTVQEVVERDRVVNLYAIVADTVTRGKVPGE
jgi:hypothetical protein